MAPSKKDRWVEDVVFVLSECARIRTVLAEMKSPASLLKADIGGELPAPSGPGLIFCGSAAALRVRRLSDQALEQSDAAGTVEAGRVHQAFRKVLVERFIRDSMTVDVANVEKAMSLAVKAAKRDRKSMTHFFPCRLMYAGDPESFAIGSVTFMTMAKFNREFEEKLGAFVRRDGPPEDVQFDERLLNDARHYYEGFTWVGQVEVKNCDTSTSKMRGQLAVTAALNFIHVLFGAYHTDRMIVGGPRMDRDKRAHLTMSEAGRIGVSTSSSATSAVGFDDGWGKFLAGEDMEMLLRSAAKAIEPLVDPTVTRPLGTRLTDAVGWFGEAVREESPAAQIVKAVTALETLVMTDEHDDIAGLLAERAAALCYHPRENETFEELEKIMRRAYDMRSRLVHGSRSPFDSEVMTYAPECMLWSERVICGGIALFETQGLLEQPLTRKQLAEGLAGLAEWAKQMSAREQTKSSAPRP